MLRFLAGEPLKRRFVAQRSVRFVIAAVLLAVSARFAPQSHSAQTDSITVCASECDHETIQAAIDDTFTDAGDTIQVLDPIHTEAGIVVTKSVSIMGTSTSGTIVQADTAEGLASDRVFEIPAGVDVTIQDMAIRFGSVTGSPARGGGILNQGMLKLDRVTIRANHAVGSPGDPGGTAEGGGIYNDGVLQIVSSTISGNEARGGGGTPGDDGGHAGGGGLFTTDGGSLTVVSSTVSGNRARAGAGGG
ncbi:MAG: hypothetical protein PVG71_15305 [Anaerolineae bacterium]